MNHISISDYDYPLADERIAKHPLEQRDACKLLVRYPDGNIEDKVFKDIVDILPEDSVLIWNNTRVINARLRFRKSGGEGALIEIFCLEPDQPRDYAQNFSQTQRCSWICFVGNSKRWKAGELTQELEIEGKTITLRALRLEKLGNASRVEFSWDGGFSFAQIIAAAGEIPIPPYLNRHTEESDSKDYQTIYSTVDGSVAAPTAGLHFTTETVEAISSRGIPHLEVTLHVGAGTFQPVKEDDVSEHMMHSEFFAVDRKVIEQLAKEDRRVIAVGTTSVRTLESLYHAGRLIAAGRWDGEVPQWSPYDPSLPQLSVKESLEAVLGYMKDSEVFVATTRLIIVPGYQYKIVKGMVTNFHQPRSTLLLLVSALIGENWRDVYSHALDNGYRFLSYGDACLFL